MKEVQVFNQKCICRGIRSMKQQATSPSGQPMTQLSLMKLSNISNLNLILSLTFKCQITIKLLSSILYSLSPLESYLKNLLICNSESPRQCSRNYQNSNHKILLTFYKTHHLKQLRSLKNCHKANSITYLNQLKNIKLSYLSKILWSCQIRWAHASSQLPPHGRLKRMQW